ncbi:hypothetical protein A5904_10055 [Acidithiobacillus caldus]|uniref:Single-stranded DNA-binding protein n=1 Tax=Acidithiobacillus caldus (strain SM-1) TaxID=990288 RepID=F9ZQN7_ACICS|nr:hypothetical protein [Acidithiobacillus caldus]AEK58637.1 hypothetical protein Atc_1989 [Acidithiobacillus caldus SM-1]AUW33194.1 hypothetical protein A5904_10055 [Acidithiobacillus caldus]MBU2801538.1 hypothetical protein [Acidithiobacillus caldus]QER45049.1 hypothetical protein F0726_01990 [Acidithiobacillus caldus]
MITAACIVTLKRAPNFRMVKDGTLALWSAFGVAGQEGIQLVAFGELAEEIDFGRLGIGDALSVVGTISLDAWQAKDGTERTTLKLVISKADPITPPEPKKRSARLGNRPAARSIPEADNDFDDDLPDWIAH